MERLSAGEAAFLQFETGSAPMQLGAIHIFDGRGAEPAPTFERFREHIKGRLHLWPRLRQRIVRVPLNLDYPYWLDDPEFYLDHHVSRRALPAPRSRQALLETAGEIISRPLDKSRPLWDIVYLEGVSRVGGVGPGSFALVGRVHQSMAAAVGGPDWVLRVSDSSPHPAPVEPRPWRPEPVPSDTQMLAKAYGRAMSSPVELARLVARGAMVAAQTVQAGTAGRGQMPPALFAAPATCWNRSITPARSITMTSIPLKRLVRIKSGVRGAQLNDVIAAVCAGALRMLLIDRRQLPDQSLIALSPVLVRDQRGKVSAAPLLLPLGTDLEDPAARLDGICAAARDSGVYARGCPLEDIADLAPLTLAVEAVRLYAGIHMTDRYQPLFNLACAYMPAQPQERYLLGAALQTRSFVPPLLDGQGLTITAVSCEDHLTIVTTGCPDRIAGLDGFTGHIQASVGELESA